MKNKFYGSILPGLVAVGLLVALSNTTILSSATVDLPLLGEFDPEEHSLFVTTILIALIDGFNPCSIWVLTVLLGITVYAGREKVILVGVTFLTVTALIYGLFIAGVLSIFAFVSHLDAIRLVVALFALTFGVVAIKDFFALDRWFSFSISDSHKGYITLRVRELMHAEGWVPTISATAVMAGGIALIELPCTAGFPVIWANLIASAEPSSSVYAALLLSYVLAYLSIELVIFGLAAITLTRFQYGETHARILKLLAGTVMSALGMALIVMPTILEDLAATIVVFTSAIVATFGIVFIYWKQGKL